jgi:hypothetical protein
VIRAKQIDAEGVGFEIEGLPYGTIELEIRELTGSKVFRREDAVGLWYPYITGLRPGTKYRYRVRIQGAEWSEWAELLTAGHKKRDHLQLVSTDGIAIRRRRN